MLTESKSVFFFLIWTSVGISWLFHLKSRTRKALNCDTHAIQFSLTVAAFAVAVNHLNITFTGTGNAKNIGRLLL